MGPNYQALRVKVLKDFAEMNNERLDKGKPSVRVGRKATGPEETLRVSYLQPMAYN
jgi:hypothetical protein